MLLNNFVKIPRISTGMCQWQWHWSMTCDFPYKKNNKKQLFLLRIEVDSHNPADNTVLDLLNDFWSRQSHEKNSHQQKI